MQIIFFANLIYSRKNDLKSTNLVNIGDTLGIRVSDIKLSDENIELSNIDKRLF